MAIGEEGLTVKTQEGWAVQALGPRNQGRARRMGFQQEMEAIGGWWGVEDRPRQPDVSPPAPMGMALYTKPHVPVAMLSPADKDGNRGCSFREARCFCPLMSPAA